VDGAHACSSADARVSESRLTSRDRHTSTACLARPGWCGASAATSARVSVDDQAAAPPSACVEHPSFLSGRCARPRRRCSHIRGVTLCARSHSLAYLDLGQRSGPARYVADAHPSHRSPPERAGSDASPPGYAGSASWWWPPVGIQASRHIESSGDGHTKWALAAQTGDASRGILAGPCIPPAITSPRTRSTTSAIASW
jgi:hypothetical protein